MPIAGLIAGLVASILIFTHIGAPVPAMAQEPQPRTFPVRDFILLPRLTTNFLENAFMTGPDEGWIVGAQGTLLHYQRGVVVDRSDPRLTDQTLHFVSFCSSEVGWAVGGLGTILRFTGERWTREDSGVRHWLQGVACINADEAWAVGAGGMILHRRHGRWHVVASPTTRALKAVGLSTRSDGWAVGTGILLRLVAGSWQVAALPVPAHIELYGLTLLGSDTGWIVGQYGTILHYDGRTWQRQPSPTDQLLEEVHAVRRDAVFACGWHGTVLRYDGRTWRAFAPLTDAKLFGCHFTSPRKGLVVGHHGLLWVYDAPERHFLPIVRRSATATRWRTLHEERAARDIAPRRKNP